MQKRFKYAQRFEYGAYGISMFQTFNLLLRFFMAITFIFSTICQMHYIFCYGLVILVDMLRQIQVKLSQFVGQNYNLRILV